MSVIKKVKTNPTKVSLRDVDYGKSDIREQPKIRYIGHVPMVNGKEVQYPSSVTCIAERPFTMNERTEAFSKDPERKEKRHWCELWDANPLAHHLIPEGVPKSFSSKTLAGKYLMVPSDQVIETGDYVGGLRIVKAKTYHISDDWELDAVSFQERKVLEDRTYVRRAPKGALKVQRDMYGWNNVTYRIERDKLRAAQLEREFRGRSKYPGNQDLERKKEDYADWLKRKALLRNDRLSPSEKERQLGYVLRDLDNRQTRKPLMYHTWYNVREEFPVKSTRKDKRGVPQVARDRQWKYHLYSNARLDELGIIKKEIKESKKAYNTRTKLKRKEGLQEKGNRNQRYGRVPKEKELSLRRPSRPSAYVYKQRVREGNPIRTYKEAEGRRYKSQDEWKTHYERSWYMTKRRTQWKSVYKLEKVAQTKNHRRSMEYTVGHSGKGQGGSYEWGHGQARFSVTKRPIPMNAVLERERYPEHKNLTLKPMKRIRDLRTGYDQYRRSKPYEETRAQVKIDPDYMKRRNGKSSGGKVKGKSKKPKVIATRTHSTRDRYGQPRYAPMILEESQTAMRNVVLYARNLGIRGGGASKSQSDLRKRMEKRFFKRIGDRGIQSRAKRTRTRNGFTKTWVYNRGSYLSYGCWDPARTYARPRDYRVGKYIPEIYVEHTPKLVPVKSWYHMQIAERDNAQRKAVSRWEAKAWEPYRAEKRVNTKMWVGYWIAEDRRYYVKTLDERMDKYVSNKKIQLALDKAGRDVMKNKKTFMSIFGDPEQYYLTRANLHKKEMLEFYALERNHMKYAIKTAFAKSRQVKVAKDRHNLDTKMQYYVDRGRLAYTDMEYRDVRTRHGKEMATKYRRSSKSREKIEFIRRPSSEPISWGDWRIKPKGDSGLRGFRGIEADMKKLMDYGTYLSRTNW